MYMFSSLTAFLFTISGIGTNNMLYDSSCSNVDYSESGTYLWPFTFDSVPSVSCTNGDPPSEPFPGKLSYQNY